MVNKMIKSHFRAACLLVAFLVQINAASAKTWTEIRFGVEAEVPPFESRNQKGELVGLDIEIGDALCAQMKMRCRWMDQPYDGNIAALKAGRFDAIVTMTPTDIRKREIDFTDLIYPLSSRLVVRKGSALLPTPVSLKGKRVGVLRGTNREAFALQQWAPAGVHIESFGLNSELIASLLAGKIDATLQDSIEIAEALLKKPEGLAFDFGGPAVVDPMLGSGVAMGIRKGDPELKSMLNQALAAIKENGVYDAIAARYLKSSTAPAVSQSGTPLQYLGENEGKPFSEAVRAGNFLYLSGILGDDATGHFPKGVAAQTAVILDKIRAVLEKHGSSLDRVVQCRVILADIGDFDAMNKVYSNYFSAGRFPARTTFAASKLISNADIEIECVALLE